MTGKYSQSIENEYKKKILKNALIFFCFFMLCVFILTGYELMQERKKGQQAFRQRVMYLMNSLYDNKTVSRSDGKLQTTASQIWNNIRVRVKDSAQDTLNGNGIRQYYSYKMQSSDGNILKQSNTQFLLKEIDSSLSQRVNPMDYLKEEEVNHIMKALDTGEKETPPSYRLLYQVQNQEGKIIPSGFYLAKTAWSTQEEKQAEDAFTGKRYSWKALDSEKNYVQTSSDIVWQWGESLSKDSLLFECTQADIMAPYYQDGYKSWQFWNTNGFLHEDAGLEILPIEESLFLSAQKVDAKGIWITEYENSLPIVTNSATFMLHIRAVRQCGLNSLYSLAGIYLLLFLIVSLCAGIVTREQIRTLIKSRQLEQDRMDFINGMAHELKTPLAVVRMCSDSLRVPELEYQKEYYLDIMNQKNEQMDGMIRQMIVLSQLNSAYFMIDKMSKRVDWLIIEELKHLDALIQQRRLSVFTTLAEVTWDIDEKYFRQLIVNLLENACYHSPKGSSIWITLTQQAFQVENQGESIPAENLNELFELFSKSNESEAGSHLGFGLYLAERVAALHGKSCTAENTKRGILFRVC